MGFRDADPAETVLLRLGRPPDPLAWPPPAFRGQGRFDDLKKAFRVMYASPSKLACLLETLDTFRPDRALLQRLIAMGPERFTPRSGLIPDEFFTRLVGRFRLPADQHWLDLRVDAPETASALNREPAIAALLPGLGYGTGLKPGDLLGSDRRLTKAVAGWAHERGYAGIAYSSSHRPRLDC